MRPTSSAFSRLPGSPGAIDGRMPDPAAETPGAAASPLVGLIRNSKSHRNKGHKEPGTDIPGVLMIEPQTKPELEEALAEFARRGIGILAISGGDGTVRDVLTRGASIFGDEWPDLVILPQGKTNALAVDLGVPRKWSLPQALQAARAKGRVTRKPIIVENVDGNSPKNFGFILGAGVFSTAIDAGQVAHRYGAFQSFAVGITTAFGIVQALFGIGESPWRRITPMQIRSGSEQNDLPHSGHGKPEGRFLAGFTTLADFPLGLRPFRKTGRAGEINFLVFDAPLRRAVALVPLIFSGADPRFLDSLGVQRGADSEFQLDLGDRFILDGEFFPAGNYRISLGPELQFIVP